MIKKEYTDILITDQAGKILYMDVGNLRAFDYHPDDAIGKPLSSLYKNITEENSTIYKALREGAVSEDVTQELISKNKKISLISSTYPIKCGSTIIGAIEFSKVIYSKDTINFISNHFRHPIYRKNNTRYIIDDIISNHPDMMQIKQIIQRVSRTDSSVLICGKTGTGKELVAQSIHNLSNRVNKPFISQNCAAIPNNLIEGILFGTIKGSFTGSENHAGLLEAANGGTLFLDEINSLSIEMQAKLLSVIEERKARRVGATKDIHLDIRIIAAMNEDAELLIHTGRLRSDFYFRLSVVQIVLPLLKERKSDIRLLANYYIDYYNSMLNRKVEYLSDDIIDKMLNYEWPGNIRELRNVIEGAFNLLEESETVIPQDFIPQKIMHNHVDIPTASTRGDTKQLTLKNMVSKYENEIILNTLNRYGYDLKKVAEALNISRQLLQYKLNKINLNPR